MMNKHDNPPEQSSYDDNPPEQSSYDDNPPEQSSYDDNLENKEDIIEEDDTPEEDDDELRGPAEALKKLRKKLKECEGHKQEYLAGWQRAKADFVNARKRSEEALTEARTYSNQSLLKEFIPVLDSFDMAFSNKEAWEKAPKEWRIGVEYIYSQFISVLTNNGVGIIEPAEGVPFDPNLHEAIETIGVEKEAQENTIAALVQKGYRIGERVIRPAKVKVFGHKEE